jgi:protein SCO1/2
MTKPERKSRLFIWGGLLLLAATLALAFLLATLKSLANAGGGKPLQVLADVADFTLTNQNGAAVSLANLRGHVWVADIIFSRCPGPCMRMGRQMKELQQALPLASQAKLITLTTDAEYDTPPVLKRYAEKYGFDSNPSQWQFLTGTKKQIANLAVGSLKFTAVEKPPGSGEVPEDLFIHSTFFVVVDKQARLRGVFETAGEGVEPGRVLPQVLGAVKQLEKER